MTREEILKGLRFTADMFLFDPSTGETKTKDQLNDMDRTTVDACEGAIELLKEWKTGRWIQFPSHNAYKCSECGRVIETTDGKNNVCKHYPYCHCGCKMEVEHDN